jgi:myosin heavy subunit
MVEGSVRRLGGLKMKGTLRNVDPQSMEDVDDMVLFNDLNDATLLHNLRRRFDSDRIYTKIGDILVSVNPFKMLPIYDKETLSKYQAVNGEGLAPHIYCVPAAAYSQMLAEHSNQAICIAGESGAGKTEAMKLVLQYLAEVSGFKNAPAALASGKRPTQLPGLTQMGKGKAKRFSFVPAASTGPKKRGTQMPGGINALVAAAEAISIEQQILQMNPVTEAFGNAKTTRNNNSSRFGKWTNVVFDQVGCIKGAHITEYLLEKSRVANQAPGERNYHCFYEMIAGMAEGSDVWPELQERLSLQPVSSYKYLMGGGIDAVGVQGQSDGEEFDCLLEAFDALGLTEEEQQSTFQLLTGVLTLGNLEYVEDAGGSGTEEGSAVSTKDVLARAALLLELDPEQLEVALVSRKMGARSVIFVPLKVEQAMAARDALAKVCYGQLFCWLIRGLNKALSKANGLDGASTVGNTAIGVLDIFGFEIFEVNSFEQLCINYCNEKLQFYFNNHIFVVEQEQYSKEGVTLDGIEFMNNGATCDLIEGPGGILGTLDEELKVPKGSDPAFLAKLLKAQGATAGGSSGGGKQQLIKRAVKAKNPSFIVVHFAGEVEYDVNGFMDKTRDEVKIRLIKVSDQDS